MGYAHEWYRVETPDGPLPSEPRDAYGRLAFDTLAIIAAVEQRSIALADGAATPGSRPVVDEGGIWLNGARPDDAETFAWPAQPGEPIWSDRTGHRWWDACKTNRQPYDLVVCSVLIRAGAHYGPSVRIISDGSWDQPLGDHSGVPGWAVARQLVVELFGAAADRSPLWA